jgi:hypothetical protein
VQDHLETAVADHPPGEPRLTRVAESSLRAFLECGVPRFGLVRFLCRRCGQDRFVALSCRRRLACISCDAQRAEIESSLMLDRLLPIVPYRQWVLVIPKRLRPLVNRDGAMAGELSRLLASTLQRFTVERTGSTGAPAQVTVIQRFGSRVNLHVHLHAVVSDGAFETNGNGRLRFVECAPPSPEGLSELTEAIRRRWVGRLRRRGLVSEEAARTLLGQAHSGFSLNAGVRIEAEDRAGLERLLRYCLRPALSIKRLDYSAAQGRVRYRPDKGRPGEPHVIEWPAEEFVERFARLVPPPRHHLVRYSGALGRRCRLRPLVTRAARERVAQELLASGEWPVAGAMAAILHVVGQAAKAASAAARSWAAVLRRVFEIDPLRCETCGDEMLPVAAILDDRELGRLLLHLGLPTAFPITKPARAPPLPFPSEECQIDAHLETWLDWGESHPKD